MAPLAGPATSAQAFVDVVASYLDRVHDDARRLGCTPGEAVEIVETTALDLLERVRFRPHDVTDVAGQWFGAARALAERVVEGRERPTTASLASADAPRAVLAAAADDQRTREALAQLADADRLVLLLRDGADLPEVSVAAALGVPPARIPALVAHARLALDGLDTAAATHLEELGRLALHVDGTLPPDQRRSVAGHLGRCAVCKAAQPRLVDARARLRSLSVVAMPDNDRDTILGRITTLARRHLPTAEQVAAGHRGDSSRAGPRLGFVAACLVGALALGALTGLASGDGDEGRAGSGFRLPTTIDRSEEPSESASPSPSPSPSLSRSPSPTASTTTGRPSPTSDSSPTASPTSSPSSSGTTQTPTIFISPSSGRQCTPIRVTGRGWRPGAFVQVSYRDFTGSTVMRATGVTAGEDGRFSATVQACDSRSLPGPHQVVATSGSARDSAPFTQTA